MKLKDKVAIITGGGRGLGRAVALAFGKEGARVVLAARTRGQIEHVAEELRSLKKPAMAIPTDISDEGQVNELVKKTLETYGTIDILVNNAGARGPISPVHQIPLDEWERTLRINLTSAFLCSRAVIPRKSSPVSCSQRIWTSWKYPWKEFRGPDKKVQSSDRISIGLCNLLRDSWT